ncbi:MAG: hypothetical protein QF506_02660, partial [Candidatus Woesearchaeota archaeon]|nr:hypothetical protein [Candidatus Woesearchaeota archaeon]
MEKFTHIICYFIIAFLFSLFISSNAEGLSCINLNGEECLIEQKCYGGEWVTADEERCCSGVCCFRSEMQEDVVLINGENQEEVTIERLSDDTIRVFYGAVISPEIGRPYSVD